MATEAASYTQRGGGRTVVPQVGKVGKWSTGVRTGQCLGAPDRVHHVLNLSLSPIWLLLLFCPPDNLGVGGLPEEGRSTRLASQLQPSARPQSRPLTWVQRASKNEKVSMSPSAPMATLSKEVPSGCLLLDPVFSVELSTTYSCHLSTHAFLFPSRAVAP